jgi:hypothetical protein
VNDLMSIQTNFSNYLGREILVPKNHWKGGQLPLLRSSDYPEMIDWMES